MSALQSGATSNGGWVRVAATLEQVEPAVSVLHAHLARHRPDVRRFEFGLLCFEGLSNAVRHGCGGDPAHTVHATLAVTGDRLELTITDDGPGFDWRALGDRPPDDDSTHGRGLWILNRYSDRVTYNERGNQLTIVKHIPRGCSAAELRAEPAG